ncbi:MAG: ABC transporter permease [Lachnospiraceae bacterium]|nr:ABC transporter permease [Lachnospiraceae bacterium]
MWKEYSSGYIKNNRSSGLSIVIAAFISALLLSLLCVLFYNAWKYEIERIQLEEGGWHSRITGALDGEAVEAIQNYANVKTAEAVQPEEESGETIVDICFYDVKSVMEDTLRIAALAGVPPESVSYHHSLLAMYLIRDPQDTAPRLLFPMFLVILALASFSLIVIIHNSFAVTMNARIHQFGIFSSIGATPKQIRSCLLQEAAALCALPVLTGNVLGILAAMGLLGLSNTLLGSNVPGRHESVFGYHPLVLGLTLLVTVITIVISAWLPARKLSKLTPLEAIKNTDELQLKRRKRSPILGLLFGMEGELAGNALKAQRKALRTASLSLVLSFLAFTIMQCFFCLSEISTGESYFQRYLNVWDIAVTVKDTAVDSFGETEKLQGLPGVGSAIVYQRAWAKRLVTESEISPDMKAFGGFHTEKSNSVTEAEGGFLVNAPLVILDDASFLSYCEQIGAPPRLDGAVVLNRIRDVTNPDFRHPVYMPYLKEDSAAQDAASILRQADNVEITAEVPVLSYTREVPALREEYATLDYYELVHFLPVSLWQEIKGQIGGAQRDTFICILSMGDSHLASLNALQEDVNRLLSPNYAIESENRIQEQEANDLQIQGIKSVFGGFCILLAVIGIGNVFSNTLGFVRQRKREFARYLSVGLTPESIRKMFVIEGCVLACRPVLLTIPVAAAAVWFMLRASYVAAGEFFAQAPLAPIAVLLLVIWGTVALAYFLGWRQVRGIDLAKVLRDDTML